MKDAFDAFLASLSDDEVEAFELSLVQAGRLALHDGTIWVIRLDSTEAVRSLQTLDSLSFWDHPRLADLEKAAQCVDFGAGDYETRGVELMRFRRVVSEVRDPEREMTLAQARALDPESAIDDELGDLDVDRTRALRHALISALRRRLPLELIEASSAAEQRVAELLDEVASTSGRTPADLATELVGEQLFWRWRVDVPTLEMSPGVREEVLRFSRSCLHYIEAIAPQHALAFDELFPPDAGMIRGLFGWLQRHRRRRHRRR